MVVIYQYLPENSYLCSMKWQNHIVSDKKILLGKPTIKGTRISVDHILGLLAQGWTEQDILQNYPRLSAKDIQAVFAYIYDNIHDGLLLLQPLKTG